MAEAEKTTGRRLSRRGFLRGSLIVGGSLIGGGATYRWVRNHSHRDFDLGRSETYLNSIQEPENLKDLPNIVLIFTDDLGYGDLGSYGSGAIRTPNIDLLAAEGARLTNAYATAPMCSPSRAGLLTGRYPIRSHITTAMYPTGSFMEHFLNLSDFYSYGVTGIPEDEVLLPEILKRRGYRTYMLGKWHLGDRSPHLPNDSGFDSFYGALYSNDMEPYRIYRDRELELDRPVDQNILTQNFTREALQFIGENQDRPFFLYYAQPFPHDPLHASEAFRGRSPAGLYGDTVEEIDWSIGEILRALRDHGLDDRTLVIFTSDNGPWRLGNPGYTRGRKLLVFEGGFIVPFIARWPNVIPEGRVIDAMSMNFDIFVTCLKAAGIDKPQDRIIDGRDILPLLKGEVDSVHDTLYFYQWRNLMAVRHQNWKYHRRHRTDNGGYVILYQGPYLFNLEIDPNESYSLIESESEIALRLAMLMDDWDVEMEANLRGWL